MNPIHLTAVFGVLNHDITMHESELLEKFRQDIMKYHEDMSRFSSQRCPEKHVTQVRDVASTALGHFVSTSWGHGM